MLTDADGLSLSISSPAARDAYVRGCDLLLTFYPGEIASLDRAIALEPGFALAHAAKAQMQARQGDGHAAQESMAAARAVSAGLPPREVSHITFFDHLMSGRGKAAMAALYEHLDAWPRDRLVLSTASNPNGLIGTSGRVGQKREIAVLMDRLAPHYGDDPWFLAQHAMALSEDGRRQEARPKIERSVEMKRDNAHAAHGFAHVCYESGEPDTARAFLSSWLAEYPRDGFFHGHLSWHLALEELEVGNVAEAFGLYRDAFSLHQHSGGPQQKMSDATAFLWRAELAGAPRDAAAWQAMHDFACSALLTPRNGLEDLHVVLAQAVMRDDARMTARVKQMQDLAREGRYAPGPYLPALAQAFAAFERQDYAGAVDALEPIATESERIGGSRAQHDIVEFTLLKAYLNADRPGDARRLLAARRAGPAGVPVAGVASVH
jgi:tetratricopeptide (TPR) repeat protein